jgi:hypothetical protein
MPTRVAALGEPSSPRAAAPTSSTSASRGIGALHRRISKSRGAQGDEHRKKS